MLWISSSSHTHHCSVRPAPPTRERHSDDSSLHAEWRWRPSQVTASPAERLKPRFQCLLICNQPHSQKVGKGRAASKLPRADQVSYPSSHQKGQPCCPLHWRAGGETQPWPTPEEPTLPPVNRTAHLVVEVASQKADDRATSFSKNAHTRSFYNKGGPGVGHFCQSSCWQLWPVLIGWCPCHYQLNVT